MGLLAEIKEDQATARKGPTCSLCAILTNIDKKDSQDLNDALADSTVYSTIICKALVRRGFRMNASTVSRHRKGECYGK